MTRSSSSSLISDASRFTALEDAHIRDRELDSLTIGRRQQNVVRFATKLRTRNFIALVELHRNFAVLPDFGEIREFVPSDIS